MDVARLNITIRGRNGDLPEPVAIDLPDEDVRRIAAEAVRAGTIPGIGDVGADADFSDFVVDRFPPGAGRDFHYLMLRPKVPFGV